MNKLLRQIRSKEFEATEVIIMSNAEVISALKNFIVATSIQVDMPNSDLENNELKKATNELEEILEKWLPEIK